MEPTAQVGPEEAEGQPGSLDVLRFGVRCAIAAIATWARVSNRNIADLYMSICIHVEVHVNAHMYAYCIHGDAHGMC